jgi:hypothetical protein
MNASSQVAEVADFGDLRFKHPGRTPNSGEFGYLMNASSHGAAGICQFKAHQAMSDDSDNR